MHCSGVAHNQGTSLENEKLMNDGVYVPQITHSEQCWFTSNISQASFIFTFFPQLQDLFHMTLFPGSGASALGQTGVAIPAVAAPPHPRSRSPDTEHSEPSVPPAASQGCTSSI